MIVWIGVPAGRIPAHDYVQVLATLNLLLTNGFFEAAGGLPSAGSLSNLSARGISQLMSGKRRDGRNSEDSFLQSPEVRLQIPFRYSTCRLIPYPSLG